jgi:hypothetical protein
MAVIVDSGELLQTVIAALVASVGITTVFSVAIWGAARFVDLSRDERRVAAVAAAALGVGALLATFATVAVGLAVMMEK